MKRKLLLLLTIIFATASMHAADISVLPGNLGDGTVSVTGTGWIQTTETLIAGQDLTTLNGGSPVAFKGFVDLQNGADVAPGDWSKYYFKFQMVDASNRKVNIVFADGNLGNWHGISPQIWQRLSLETEGVPGFASNSPHAESWYCREGGCTDYGTGTCANGHHTIYPTDEMYYVQLVADPATGTFTVYAFGNGNGGPNSPPNSNNSTPGNKWWTIGSITLNNLTDFNFTDVSCQMQLWASTQAQPADISTINWYAADLGQEVSLSDSPLPPIVWVNGSFTGGEPVGTPGWDVTRFSSIQDAIDAVSTDGTVNIADGTYTEQVHVSKEGLSILGAGVASTTIVSPATLAVSFSTSKDYKAIVCAHTVDNLILSDVTIDGNGQGNGNSNFLGLAFWNAGGTVTNVDIKDVRETPFSGAQHGVGVFAYNNTGGPYTIAIDGMNVTDYQKNALALSGDGLSVDLNDITTVGAGSTPVTAQNGIQISYGAGGTISNSSVTGNIYTGGGWASSGILLYSGTSVDIINTTVTDNYVGIYGQDMAGSATGCDVANNDPDSWDGIYIKNIAAKENTGNEKYVASPVEEEYTGSSPETNRNFDIDDCTFIGHDKTDSWGVYARSDLDLLTVTMTNSIVQDWDLGVYTRENGGTVNMTANYNQISSNLSYGFYNTSITKSVQDATNNWWGHNTGPYHPTLNPAGMGNDVGDDILFDPWLLNPEGDMIDIAIREVGCAGFEIILRPNFDPVDFAITNVQFTIKYPETVELINIDSISFGFELGYSPNPPAGFKYMTFVGLSLPNVGWLAGQEYVVMTFSHDQSGVAPPLVYGDFEIVPPDDPEIYIKYYAEYLGLNATGIVFENALNSLLTGCPVWNQTQDLYYYNIQPAISEAIDNDVIITTPWEFYENIVVDRPVDLRGANYGVPGCGTRTDESVINGAGTAVEIAADDVSLDGFKIVSSIGVECTGHSNVTIQNNYVMAEEIGIGSQAVTSPYTVQENCVFLSGQTYGSQGFETDPVLSNTQAPGVWYVDRYPPYGFVSEFFDGDYRLKHSIDASDVPNDPYYQYQGRKYDTPGANAFSIDLYIPLAWQTTDYVRAGMWATASNGNLSYPIVEFTTNDANPRFRIWQSNIGWIDIGLPTGFAYDSWYTLSLELDINSSQVLYNVGDLSYTVDSQGADQFLNVILQGHNPMPNGATYDIYWDNLNVVGGPDGNAPTVGIAFAGASGATEMTVLNNSVYDAFYGYILYAINAGTRTFVEGGEVDGVMQGVAVVNTIDWATYLPSTVGVKDMLFDNFAGAHPSMPDINFHSGVYVYTTGNNTSAVVDIHVENVEIYNTGNPENNSAGIQFADFSTETGNRLNAYVVNCLVQDNDNRGVFVRGLNTTAQFEWCDIFYNGANPTAGSTPTGVFVSNGAVTTMNNCDIVNPAGVADAYAISAREVGASPIQGWDVCGTLTATDNSILPVDGNTALNDGATSNLVATCNWWGTGDYNQVVAIVPATVEFIPFLTTGNETGSPPYPRGFDPVGPCQAPLPLQVLLQGPYDVGTGLMLTGLNSNSVIPNDQPFNVWPWFYAGTETLPSPLPPEVVDWVLLELRETETTPGTILVAGLLYEDGTVTANFEGVDQLTSYYIVVHHRNHLPVMSASAVSLSAYTFPYDFTVLTNVYSNGAILLDDTPDPDVYGMIAGDVTHNGMLKYSGADNDRGPIIALIVANTGSPLLNGVTHGYYFEDVNMNYEVRYVGGGNDRDDIIANIIEMTGQPWLNLTYTTPVPGAYYTSKDGNSNDGPLHLAIREAGDWIELVLQTGETIKNGFIDNIQFTLAWNEGDMEIAKMVDGAQSAYDISAQGDGFVYEEKRHIVFVGVTPVYLPQTFLPGDEVVVMRLPGTTDMQIGGRLLIAEDEMTEEMNGLYYVSVCGTNMTGYVKSTELGMEELNAGSVSIYPNPVSDGTLNVLLPESTGEELQVTLTGMQGQTVLKQETRSTGRMQLDVSELESGVYLLNIRGVSTVHNSRVVIR